MSSGDNDKSVGAPQSDADFKELEALQALQELQELLLGDLGDDVEVLKKRTEDLRPTAEGVGDVLPEAVRLRGKKDQRLTHALARNLEERLEIVVRKRPKKLAEVIFPVVGPALRRAFSSALSRSAQTLNQTLEHTLSPQALKWRLEAYRTGKPFAEVVLSRTLLYRVEHVLLIHLETGQLLCQSSHGTTEASDLVSGMLTAIQDFVRDSFHSDGDDSLESMDVGDLTVWFERGPKAAFAAIVRGSPPRHLREALEGGLKTIHRENSEALAAFDGDVIPFEPCEPVLESCLLEARVDADKPRRATFAWVALGLLLLGLLGWQLSSWNEGLRWVGYVERLKQEPGIVVIEDRREGGAFVVRGLRDPLAATPETFLERFRLDARAVKGTWEPYFSLEPELVRRRAVSILQPPGSVQLDVGATGVLVASGSARQEWIERFRTVAPTVAGVSKVVGDGTLAVTDARTHRLQRLQRLLMPPPNVELALRGDKVEVRGEASSAWIREALLLSQRTGGPELDLSAVRVGRDDEQLRRVTLALRPPASVELTVEGGEVVATGKAARAWIQEAQRLAPLVEGFDASSLDGLEQEETVRVDRSRRFIEEQVVFFERDSKEVQSAGVPIVEAVAVEMKRLLIAAETLGLEMSFEVRGHTEKTRDGGFATKLSLGRAASVRKLLEEQGVPAERLRSATAKAAVAGGKGALRRRVSFHVDMSSGGKP